MVVAETVTSQGLVVIERRSSIPNDTVPPESDPGTVGVIDTVVVGDPNGVEIEPSIVGGWHSTDPARTLSGWPAEWQTPSEVRAGVALTDTAWTCLDSKLVDPVDDAARSSSGRLVVAEARINNPSPDLYQSWEEFAKQLFWDYQGLGEAFVRADRLLRVGVPRPVPCGAAVDGDRRDGRVGSPDASSAEPRSPATSLHVRYKSRGGDGRGRGPLEVGAPRLVAAAALSATPPRSPVPVGCPSSVLRPPANASPPNRPAKLRRNG